MPFRKIVLIDDDVEDQEIFKIALNDVSEMLECVTFSDAQQALSMLIEKELEPDVIFLDLNMPAMTGQEFLAEVKRRHETRQIPVIIFSTSASPTAISRAKEMGAKDFITKPDTFDELVDMLKPAIQ